MFRKASGLIALHGDVVVGSSRQYACSHGNHYEASVLSQGIAPRTGLKPQTHIGHEIYVKTHPVTPLLVLKYFANTDTRFFSQYCSVIVNNPC
jgi:hypothetical protein